MLSSEAVISIQEIQCDAVESRKSYTLRSDIQSKENKMTKEGSWETLTRDPPPPVPLSGRSFLSLNKSILLLKKKKKKGGKLSGIRQGLQRIYYKLTLVYRHLSFYLLGLILHLQFPNNQIRKILNLFHFL